MIDKLKEIPQKVLEWWNKFSSKQKTIIICIAAGVMVTLAILVTLLTRPQYELLVTCETTKEASQITELLDGESLTYRVSDDGYQIYILKEQLSDANLLLGANDIPAAAYDPELSTVFDGGFSTTEADKQKKYKLYMENHLEEDLTRFESVKKAEVQLSLPENDGTLLSKEEEAFASVILELEGEFTPDHAAAMAQFVKTALGNENANNITILDSMGNLLFSGEDSYSTTGNASNQLSVKQQAENLVRNEVKKVLLGTNEYDNVEVASNLSLDFSTTELTEHLFYPADGQSQGVLSHEDIYNAENVNNGGGVPGTDSNSETTYVMPDSENSASTVSEESRDYLPNEKITNQTIPPGLIKYDESSISVAAITYKVLREEDARGQGLLDGITWEEYKAANSERVRRDVDQEMVNMVAMATGIAPENIALVAYDEPMFIDRESTDVSASDVIQVILIILILGLLGFVLFRSMRGEKQAEEEEELEVEDLLQSMQGSELEDIDLAESSDTKKMIEKFVDENPEAVANLLRNWLSEDWG